MSGIIMNSNAHTQTGLLLELSVCLRIDRLAILHIR